MEKARGWAGIALALALAAVLAACGAENAGAGVKSGNQDGEPPNLPAVTFETAGGGTATLYVEVADTPELSSCGLMHRLEMPDNQGMLFVFESDYTGGFWNRNTFIPLQLAWIAADGRIVDLSDMENVRPEDNPQVNTTYTAREPARYVIEANQGWFSRNGIAIGDYASVSEAVARGSEGAVPICRERGL